MTSEYMLVSALSHDSPDETRLSPGSVGNTLPELRTVFSLTLADGLQAAVGDPATAAADTGGVPTASRFRLRVIRQGAGTRLVVLLPRGSLVNGRPALGLAVVQPRDLIATPDGGLYFVTARVTPHFALATPEMLGVKCGVCRLKIEPGDFVLSCRCGLLLHWETDETTPGKAAPDRSDCAVGLRACPGCSQRLGRSSFLTFDPRDPA